MKILFASANSASAYMDLEREQRNLQQLAATGKHSLQVLPAVEVGDLRDALTSMNGALPYDVFHFSGHVTEADGLQLRGKGRQTETLGSAELKQLLRDSGVRLVLLNACNSGPLALSLSGQVAAAIGAHHRVRDVVARQFTRNFYGGLNANKTANAAFRKALANGKQGHPAYGYWGDKDPLGAADAPALSVVR